MQVENNVMPHLIGKTYSEVVAALRIEDDQGDCCGWANYEVNDSLKDNDALSKAVLTNTVKINYEDTFSDRVVVNFVFAIGNEKGLILGYDLKAGSGSGWSYGAFCTLLHDDITVATAQF